MFGDIAKNLVASVKEEAAAPVGGACGCMTQKRAPRRRIMSGGDLTSYMEGVNNVTDSLHIVS